MSILDNLNSLSKKAQGYADIAVDLRRTSPRWRRRRPPTRRNPLWRRRRSASRSAPFAARSARISSAPTAAHPWATKPFCVQKKDSPAGLSFFARIYFFTHFSEEEIPISSRSASRALSSFHVMVLPLRVYPTDSSAVKPLSFSLRYSRSFSVL